MRSVARTVVLLCAVGLMGACASTFKATHDHDPAHNFDNYQKFAWISENPMQVGAVRRVPNPLLQPRIMAEVEAALTAKGYRQVSRAESPDFVLAFTIGSREEIKVDQYPSTYYRHGGAYRWGGAYYGYGTNTRVRQYTKGMLAIDVFDVAERRPVWHGVAEKTISESDREDAEGTIKAAVDAILAGFPPQ